MATSNKYSFAGKRVWIIGASTGIGAALARRLAPECSALALSARSETGLRALAEEIGRGAVDVRSYPMDVTDAGSATETALHIQADMGAIDALIYCAGDWTAVEVPALEIAAFEQQAAVNYLGMVRAIAAVLPTMTERRSGLIVGLSSATAYLPLPTAEAYGASKAAVNYLLRNLRLDVARHGVDVVTVCPGFVRTPLSAKNRFRMPFMVSPESAAESIVDGVERGRSEIHFPLRLTLPMKFIGWLPRRISEWLVVKAFKR